jgi:hypothetical protein
MAAGAGRLIAPLARFRRLRDGRFVRLFASGAGLRLAPLEIFAKGSRQPGFFPGVGGVRFLGHRSPVSRLKATFKLCLPGPNPYGKPCPARARLPPRFRPKVRCRSSVVEHLIGNEEVHSSILCGSTISNAALHLRFFFPALRFAGVFDFFFSKPLGSDAAYAAFPNSPRATNGSSIAIKMKRAR